MRSADGQARWMQELVEQNARLMGQFPATMKTFNDSLERFNQTVGRLDRAVTRIEAATRTVTGPLERFASAIDPTTLRELPETLEALRREAVPALRAATETESRVASLQTTLDRIVGVIADLPGAGVLRRLTARDDAGHTDTPAPGRTDTPAAGRRGRTPPGRG